MIRSLLNRLPSLGINHNKYSVRTLCTKPKFDIEMNRIVWIDMEMTGLDIETDKVLEIACLITDADLNIIAESEDLIIHQPNSILDAMGDWCTKHHKKTGLTDASKASSLSVEDAENNLLEFLSKHVTKGASPLAGNSVYMDKIFLKKYLPQLNSYLHYRIIDVSTIKELCKRWNSEVYKKAPKKEFVHRALPDIRESVSELRYYREYFLK